MNKLEEAAGKELMYSYAIIRYDQILYDTKAMFNMFKKGAEWADKYPISPWIDIDDRRITMPNDKGCLLRLENGVIVRDTEEWEGVYPFPVTHWMEIPSFDGILESNKDVLNRMKEKGD